MDKMDKIYVKKRKLASDMPSLTFRIAPKDHNLLKRKAL